MIEDIFGIDVSRWQGSVNWAIVAQHVPKVRFAGIRATVSWNYEDTQFQHNWADAKQYGIARMAYHVIYPTQDARQQINKFFSVLGADRGELPLVLDIELTADAKDASGNCKVSKEQYQESIQKCAELIEQWDNGRKPILYSRASFIDGFVTGNTALHWLNQYDWWLAHYGQKVNGITQPRELPPALPVGISASRAVFHQYWDGGAPIGTTQCSAMDYNRVLLPDRYYQLSNTQPAAEEHLPTVSEMLLGYADRLVVAIEHIADRFGI